MPLKQLFLILFFLLSFSSVQAAERVALVIGNQQYKDAPLRNPVGDARSIAQALTRMGFVVSPVYNANSDKLNNALDLFEAQAKQAKIALVFYAGHGIQMGGKNYLIPTNVVLKNRRDIRKLINLDDIVSGVGLAKQFGVVILDACRNNPFGRSLGVSLGRDIKLGRGLARIDNPVNNVYVATATKAGGIAADGQGNHSPYTLGLLANIEKAKDVRFVFGDVRAYVRNITKNRQLPDAYSALEGSTYCLTRLCEESDDKKEQEKRRLELEAERRQRQMAQQNKAREQQLQTLRIKQQQVKARKEQLARQKRQSQAPSKKGGRRIGQYIDHGNGTVTDTKTKLMWKKCSEGQSGNNCSGYDKIYTWYDAVKRFKRVSFAGHNDWRMPTIKELQTLIYCSNGTPQRQAALEKGCNKDYSMTSDGKLAIHNNVFPKTSWLYWSSSPYADGANDAWDVYFNLGLDLVDSKYSGNHVRLVRSGQ